jgi:hypothetical protein
MDCNLNIIINRIFNRFLQHPNTLSKACVKMFLMSAFVCHKLNVKTKSKNVIKIFSYEACQKFSNVQLLLNFFLYPVFPL